eukprot:CAMPEP_0174296562 /NCGR_PEP_ID=MMETSP0809-20121228/48248_1 /TAXON_ID=73025 ORGANISM="Eutreptiella gymnastica-like, Strain CCMP1594" /NCGR_SAMPLE_ID=MMETSP0809 /ASSEMBLY_ACC=CAM_ASM_000658 /LENGTH=94 /DNA_ID=CAMNT_0015399649 /DNA_START=28 /DNA_END=308 /DNA_ORIENTATION=+
MDVMGMGPGPPTPILPPDWENPVVVERNKTPPHVPLNPYPTVESALLKGQTPYVKSLDGRWRFKLFQSPEATEANKFFEPNFSCDTWDQISVPS